MRAAFLMEEDSMPPDIELWAERAVSVIVVGLLVLLMLLASISILRLLIRD